MADEDYKRLCSIVECGGTHKAHGYCLRHYRQHQRGGVKEDAKTCAHCGEPMNGRLANAMYCGRACKLKAWKASNQERWAELNGQYTPLARKVSAYHARYCPHCGMAFGGRRPRTHCSDKCEHAARYAANPVSVAPSSRTCPICRSVFAPVDAASMQSRMCSPECVDRARRKLHAIGKQQRAARMRGVLSERVDPFRVFDRDGWRCRLCGVRTPKAKRGTYDNDAPELDHIIPLSKGGAHSYLNTQCACRKCNGAKSDRPLGQLLLVG